MSLGKFLAALANATTPATVFHPWRDFDAANDVGPDAPEHRLRHLTAYLEARLGQAKLLLIAEAPGYRGCKFSGIAMTSERALLQDSGLLPSSPYFDGPKNRTSNVKAAWVPADGMIEPTASIVWSAIGRLNISPREVVLWNSYAFHPWQPGDRMSNRTPQDHEIQDGLPILEAFLGMFPSVRTVAVGRKAEVWLQKIGAPATAVRHPANGGATAFNQGLDEALATLRRRAERAASPVCELAH